MLCGCPLLYVMLKMAEYFLGLNIHHSFWIRAKGREGNDLKKEFGCAVEAIIISLSFSEKLSNKFRK